MERNVNFTIIGVIFFSILSALVIFIMIMGNFNLQKDEYTNYVVYTTKEITGIGVNTPVRFKGINIGSVTYVGFDKQNPDVVKIMVQIKKHIPIKEGSTLMADSQGLAGITFLTLKQSNSKIFITGENGALLNFEPSLFHRLSTKANQASTDIIDILKDAKNVLNEKNIESVSHILTNIKILSANLNQTQKDIDRLTNNFDTLVNNLNKQIQSGDYNIKGILDPMILRLNMSLNYMDRFFKRGSGVLEKFERDPYNTLFGEQKK
ncbi:MlaD family protein [Helicobacter mustelae]|uniref:Putative possible ABC transport system periplasmic substrate-binding protein n=1 Tax=Helicobacter mustelae (strain ATCC 43772 / CCUG 25715 / CIP 103759 / LMG 18044 / NCTC 12198 / R85-136P) TaxID=679897 RepID=D3UJD6_HELM1|nr:MlaD family protein [Helicobacter mustelae]CBG40612.1 putative possible ABC transport system periplasmic substrate-binding protein [Helicobacter mustelae 12198]SQH72110.1 ABC transporter periplasmic substrate-binding protein [Helicobacter mustelae]